MYYGVLCKNKRDFCMFLKKFHISDLAKKVSSCECVCECSVFVCVCVCVCACVCVSVCVREYFTKV